MTDREFHDLADSVQCRHGQMERDLADLHARADRLMDDARRLRCEVESILDLRTIEREDTP